MSKDFELRLIFEVEASKHPGTHSKLPAVVLASTNKDIKSVT